MKRELEELWCRRLADSKLRVDFARNFLREVEPDSPEHAEALRAESAAQADYIRVLRLYTHLVLDSKIPDAHEWRQAVRWHQHRHSA